MFELRISVVEHRIHNNTCLLVLSWAQLLGWAEPVQCMSREAKNYLKLKDERSQSQTKRKEDTAEGRHADAGRAEEQRNYVKGAEPSQSTAEIVIKNLIFNVFLNWTMTS